MPEDRGHFILAYLADENPRPLEGKGDRGGEVHPQSHLTILGGILWMGVKIKNKGLDFGYRNPALPGMLIPTLALSLANSEHLGAAYRAHTLGCGLTILHDDASSVPHLSLCPTLHAVSLHFVYLLS